MLILKMVIVVLIVSLFMHLMKEVRTRLLDGRQGL